MANEKRRRPGRPRKEDERPPTVIIDERELPRPEYLPRDFVEICAKRYKAATRPLGSRGGQAPAAGFISRAARASGDPLFSDDPALALAAYGIASAPRPNTVVDALKGKIFGGEAQLLADYARAYSRSIGVSLHFAIADAVATCAERGTFIISRGAPASFERAIRCVYEALEEDLRGPDSIGDTGRRLHVKPAREGAIVRRPESNMRPLDPDGEEVPDNLFWRRRLLNGDVVEVP